MLSEEEKAINEVLLSVIEAYSGYEGLQKISEEYKNTKTVLNLIEKQQKEIELLKEENEKYKNPPFFDEDEYIEIDKIKAKMKEKEWSLENYDCTEADYKQSQAIGAWSVLQSLLEKE